MQVEYDPSIVTPEKLARIVTDLGFPSSVIEQAEEGVVEPMVPRNGLTELCIWNGFKLDIVTTQEVDSPQAAWTSTVTVFHDSFRHSVSRASCFAGGFAGASARHPRCRSDGHPRVPAVGRPPLDGDAVARDAPERSVHGRRVVQVGLGEGLGKILEESWKVLGMSSEGLGEDLRKTLEDPSKDLPNFGKALEGLGKTFQDPSKDLPRLSFSGSFPKIRFW